VAGGHRWRCFYYDFAIATPFTPEDLERIELKMREVVAADHLCCG